MTLRCGAPSQGVRSLALGVGAHMFGEPLARAVEPFDQPGERNIQRLRGLAMRKPGERHQQQRLAQFEREARARR